MDSTNNLHTLIEENLASTLLEFAKRAEEALNSEELPTITPVIIMK